jgi:hypothetical protein
MIFSTVAAFYLPVAPLSVDAYPGFPEDYCLTTLAVSLIPLPSETSSR